MCVQVHGQYSINKNEEGEQNRTNSSEKRTCMKCATSTQLLPWQSTTAQNMSTPTPNKTPLTKAQPLYPVSPNPRGDVCALQLTGPTDALLATNPARTDRYIVVRVYAPFTSCVWARPSCKKMESFIGKLDCLPHPASKEQLLKIMPRKVCVCTSADADVYFKSEPCAWWECKVDIH